MPEFPLDIQLSDPKLNQIKGWRVPNGLRPEYVDLNKNTNSLLRLSPYYYCVVTQFFFDYFNFSLPSSFFILPRRFKENIISL